MQPEIPLQNSINIDELETGKIHRINLHVVSDGMGNPIAMPIMVAKGVNPGPVVGLVAAIHGNEINGLPVIQKVFKTINPKELSGVIIGVLVANVPGFLLKQRRFNDSVDLNHIMPGKKHGNKSQIYAYRLVRKILRLCNYLIDLHTASFGRINSYYVRADLEDETIRQMALLQNADMILQNKGLPGTFRRAAVDLNISAITVELRDPHMIQKDVIAESVIGIKNLLIHLKSIPGTITKPEEKSVICKSSEWLYSDTGGLLDVIVNIRDYVKEGQLIAKTRNMFGDVIREYHSPYYGIIIGKTVEPVCQTGSRIIHIGKLSE